MSQASRVPFLSSWLPRGEGYLRAHHALMLRTLIHEQDVWWTADDRREVRRVLEAVARQPQRAALRATPFFWSELDGLWAAVAYDERPTRASLARLHVLAFDSFPEVVGQTRVTGWDDGSVVLPRCGVELRGDGPCVHLDPRSVAADACRVRVRSRAGGRVLASSSPALFDEHARADIDPHADPQAFAAQVARAHALIGHVRPALLERLGQAIGWYVPLCSPDARTHRSFSLETQSGVMFLSPTDDRVRLAEAMVHELGHTELGHTARGWPLVLDARAPSELLYSPWRPDPRPLLGLLHGLYVFCEVASFLACLLPRRELESQHEWIAQRRTLTLLRLRLGLAQVPRAALAEFGHELVDRIDAYVARYAHELRGVAPPLRAAIAEHCSRFREANPGLRVVVPPLHPLHQERLQ